MGDTFWFTLIGIEAFVGAALIGWSWGEHTAWRRYIVKLRESNEYWEREVKPAWIALGKSQGALEMIQKVNRARAAFAWPFAEPPVAGKEKN